MPWKIALVVCFLFTGLAHAQFKLTDDTARGRLHITEDGKNVLGYNYGMQLNTGADPRYERGCYVHPLWDANGWQRTITEDFAPLDGHLHHRGLGWTWPHVEVGEYAGKKAVQTWHPCDPPLRQHFVKWIKREANEKRAVIAVENAWILETDKPKSIVKETVEIVAHPITKIGEMPHNNPQKPPVPVMARAIDFTLTFQATDQPVKLFGAGGKGYGGFMIRGSYDMPKGAITIAEGPLNGDRTRCPTPWADLSHGGRGVAIFTHPDHPPHPDGPKNKNRDPLPPRWLLRTSFAGLLNCAWPGVEPCVLQPGKPVTLRYRVYVHRGDAKQAKVAEAYKQYVREMNKQ